MQVELVHTTTSDQVPLDGYLRTPSTAETATSGFLDLVICHHGVGSRFYTPSFFDRAGDELLQLGCAVLRVNNRGHDDAFLVGERPFGAAYEIIDDCRTDITAWLDFAEARGFSRIALWGHSLGAVKTIYFLAVQDDARISCAIASSPPRFAYALHGTPMQSAIQRAQELVSTHRGLELIEATVPVRRHFAAQTYLDKYGPDDRYDYMAHLPRVRKPLLLTVGSLEADNVSFSGLVEQGATFSGRWSNVQFAAIDGADHAYTNRTSELWSVVKSWLERAATGQPAAR